MKESLRILMGGLVDYAGLFPPAQLSMSEALEQYLSYRTSGDAWMLGRFIVPSSRLGECENALSQAKGASSIPLSVLVQSADPAEIQDLVAFNGRCGESLARITTVECTMSAAGDAKRYAQTVGGRFVTYCEIPLAEDFGDLVKETAEAGVRAKLRTGGITEGSIPATSDVVRFLFACAAKRLPFKATAGLHHPLRGLHALTYAPGAPKDVMHGFLNLFLVAAFLVEGMEVSEAIQLMEEANPMALGFDNAFVRWRSHTLSVDRLALARRGFAMNFGSCSFREPIDELTELGFL